MPTEPTDADDLFAYSARTAEASLSGIPPAVVHLFEKLSPRRLMIRINIE